MSIIKVQVTTSDGDTFTSKEIDLTKKIQAINIDDTKVERTYVAADLHRALTDITQDDGSRVPVSGGQVFKPQKITYVDPQSKNTQQKTVKTSLNIKGRYDKQDKHWNIDIYVNIDEPKQKEIRLGYVNCSLILKDKRLKKIHDRKVHKIPDCEWIDLEWWKDNTPMGKFRTEKP